MFILTRVANGIIVLLAILFGIFVFNEGSSGAMDIIKLLGSVTLFYITDLALRKKTSPASFVFSLIWVVIYLYFFWRVLGGYPPKDPDLAFASLLLIFLFGVPLFFNCIQLTSELLRPHKE